MCCNTIWPAPLFCAHLVHTQVSHLSCEDATRFIFNAWPNASFGVILVGGIASLTITLLYYFQEKLLYVPNVPGVPEEYALVQPDRYGFVSEDVWLQADDGVKLHAWLLRLKTWSDDFVKSRPIIMFFQENAGTMTFRLPYLYLVASQLQCPIFALSYRGYGSSQGKPNQAGLMLDAQAALRHVLSRRDVDHSRIVLFGRSLGGAVAIALAAAHQSQIRALIIENTFTSVEDMASQILPVLRLFIGTGRPCNFLVTNKWRSIDLIGSITDIPILMLSSKLDEMVPPVQMQQLRQAAHKSTFVELPDSHHMTAYETNREIYWPTLTDFLQQHIHKAD